MVLGRSKAHIRGPKGHSALWKRPSENLDHRMNCGFPILVCLVIKPTPIEALVIPTFKNDILHFEIIFSTLVALESSNKDQFSVHSQKWRKARVYKLSASQRCPGFDCRGLLAFSLSSILPRSTYKSL